MDLFRSRLPLLLLSVTLFFIACGFEALEFRRPLEPARGTGPESVRGITCLLFGFTTLEQSPLLFLAWSANPFLIAAWVCLAPWRTKAARWLVIIAFVLASLVWLSVAFTALSAGGQRWPDGPSRLLPGYFFWKASMLVLFVGTFFIRKPRT